MKSIDELFRSGWRNPETGFRSRDWFAVGCIFSQTPIVKDDQILIAMRMMLSTDVATTYVLGHEPIAEKTDALDSDQVINFLKKITERHGTPRCGFVISHSAWLSSEELALDEDTAPRAEVLKQFDVHFGSMQFGDKSRIEAWVKDTLRVRCEFDGNKID
jgi:hypothetical protein